MRAALHNLGCKVNSYEIESMREQLVKNGFEIVEFSEIADVYVVNTCSVTNIADRKSRQMLHRAKKLNPNGIVVACGCYVQQIKEELLKDEAVDIIIGNNNKSNLVDTINSYIKDKNINKSLVDIDLEKSFEETPVQASDENIRVNVKVQDGCNNFCTYCIIPYTRGRIRSRNVDDIVKEITKLADKNYKEFILNGINLSSYGMDLEGTEEDNGIRLLQLIEKIHEIKDVERIRLSSLEPRVITSDFVEGLRNMPKVCHHFHLSMQSGCDETLKRMNRHYTSDEYYKCCETIRSVFPNAAITTDVIVGFPGETEEEFNKTYEFVKKVKFADLHVFKYSKRKGTKAEKMPDQVPDQIKHERSEKLIELGKKMSNDYALSFIGGIILVLFEEMEVIDGVEYYVGHTEEYLKVKFPKEWFRRSPVNLIRTLLVSEEFLILK